MNRTICPAGSGGRAISLSAALCAAFVFFFSAAASAQLPPAAPPPPQAPAPPQQSPDPGVPPGAQYPSQGPAAGYPQPPPQQPPPGAPAAGYAVPGFQQQPPPPPPEAERPIPNQTTGLDYVVGRWGFGLQRTDAVISGTANPRETAVIDSLGIRYWTSHRMAVEAGLGALVLAPDATVPVVAGLAAQFGVPVAISQWPYLTTYVKPQISGYFARFGDDFHRYQIAASALAGAELHLGWMFLPAVSLAAEGGIEVAFAGGRNPGAAGGTFTGNTLRFVRPATLDSLITNISLRVYF